MHIHAADSDFTLKLSSHLTDVGFLLRMSLGGFLIILELYCALLSKP